MKAAITKEMVKRVEERLNNQADKSEEYRNGFMAALSAMGMWTAPSGTGQWRVVCHCETPRLNPLLEAAGFFYDDIVNRSCVELEYEKDPKKRGDIERNLQVGQKLKEKFTAFCETLVEC